jgi:hypothetical protein
MVMVNTSNMLPSEKAMFDSICDYLNRFREGVLCGVLSGKVPDIDCILSFEKKSFEHTYIDNQGKDSLRVSLGGTVVSDSSISSQSGSVDSFFAKEPSNTDSTLLAPEEPKDLKSTSFSGEVEPDTQMVRLVTSIEEIVGPDLQIYGPYEKGALISLPKELAGALIAKKQAEGVYN